jgi:NAD(P)-dependent dehydrogenase (short-subunit alcohol dehydrogenase family)
MKSITTPQQPIHSGFGPSSTATDVLNGIDLSGKLALVTGGYSGIGMETTHALTAAGAHVVVPARRPEAAEAALADLAGTEVDELDLTDIASVARFAERFLASGRDLDIAVLGAGIMAIPETRVGPGWEAQLAVNHLGHFALVNRLWPALRPGARVVGVSSTGHHLSGIRWEDVHFTRGYDKWLAYAQAKTAVALTAVHLNRLAATTGVRAFAVHPGAILTPLQRHLESREMVEAGWVDQNGAVVATHFKTPEQGAATQVWAATSPALADRGGVFCQDCDIAALTDRIDMDAGGVMAHAVDPDEAARLWALSAELTGVTWPGADTAR